MSEHVPSSSPATPRALALVCSLKPSPSPSSSDVMARQVLEELAGHGYETESVRVADYDVRPGVEADMGDGDQWPWLRRKLYDADVLVFATPTWVGHMSSIAQRVLERLDAELSETDEQHRPALYGKVAVVAVVGNEDGAHKIIADAFQGLNDMGYTVAAQGGTYWNAEAMNPREYRELDSTPEAVASTTRSLAANAAHVASLLRQRNYPAT
ncbi:NAD(P)H-dependent oxidoreductase [Saccharomonospora sp. NPDC006951]